MNKTTLLATIAAMAVLAGVTNGCDAEEVDEIGVAPPIEGAAPPPPARDSVRLKIDQLQNSLPTIAGDDADGAPISWLYEFNGQRIGLFGVLGSTLGDPDYVSVTDEPGVPNAMYLKFGSDIALNVCRQMTEADAVAGSGQRTLTRCAPIDGSAAEADIEANIRYLHLRFLGVRAELDAPRATDAACNEHDAASAA